MGWESNQAFICERMKAYMGPVPERVGHRYKGIAVHAFDLSKNTVFHILYHFFCCDHKVDLLIFKKCFQSKVILKKNFRMDAGGTAFVSLTAPKPSGPVPCG